MTAAPQPRPLRLALIAGEPSGDALGASLLREIRRRFPAEGAVEILGVGGAGMAAEGLESLFPQEDIAVNGIVAVIPHLPVLFRRMRETAQHLAEQKPDLVLTIDSPDFSLRVAKRLRKLAPSIPIVHWVCPSVWAWRPGRARAMAPHVDRVLCLLPFEPRELARLWGPEGVYVGHPLIERLGELRPHAKELGQRANQEDPLILVLPGSRKSEIAHHLALFGEAVARIARARPKARFVLPMVPHVARHVREGVARWAVQPELVEGEADKLAAFRQARVALAASGTVTLELALSGVPTIAAYKVTAFEALIARLVLQISTVLLPNLVLGEKAVPEFLQENATPEKLAEAVLGLLPEGPARQSQLAAFARLDEVMRLPGDQRPSQAALDACLVMPGVAER